MSTDSKVFNKENDFDTRLLKPSKLSTEECKKMLKKYVELVCLEMSYYCNRACNYCPVHTMERSDKNLEIRYSFEDEYFALLQKYLSGFAGKKSCLL